MVVVRVTVDGREVSAFVLAEEGKVSSSGKSMVLGTANVKMVADDGRPITIVATVFTPK